MRRLAWILVALVALAFTACGGDGGESTTTAVHEPVRIGSKNFTESEILGELYKQALEAKGLTVELQSAVGPTEVINTALRDGLLDLYPEYIGVLLSEVDKIVDRPQSAAAAYRLAKSIEERRKFTLLEPSRLSNENALAVTKTFARKHDVNSIDDLKRLRPAARLGAAPEFLTRFEGMIGLRQRYGLKGLKTARGPEHGHALRGTRRREDRRRLGLHDRQPAARRPLHAARGSQGRLRQAARRAADQPQGARHPRTRAGRHAQRRQRLPDDARHARANRLAGVEMQTPVRIADEFLRTHGLK